MRNFAYGLCLVALTFSSHLAAETFPVADQITGAAVPSLAEVVDSAQNVWTLSDGQAYENGKPTPSSGVILLVLYGGVVYQENIHHNWWLWDPSGEFSWTASSDPRVMSPSGTTVPAATQIVDSQLNVWTVSAGGVYEKGQRTPSADVILLLYAKGTMYQENIHHDWWLWRTGAWVATAAPLLPSASGTAVPTAKQIVDGELDLWTVSGGKVYENHALTPSDDVILLLFHDGNVYQENIHHDWWEWNGQAWSHFTNPPYQDLDGTAISPDNAKLYSNAYSSGSSPSLSPVIPVFNPATGAVTAKIPGVMTVGVFSPDSQHLYGVSGGYGAGLGGIGVIDTATDTPTTAVANILAPQHLAITPDGKHLYITNNGTGSVLVADTATYTISTTIPVSGLGAIAIVPAH